MKTILKDAIYETIHHSKKPLKQIAEDVDMSVSYLTRAGLPDSSEMENGSGCPLPLKKVVPITVSTGNFAILDCMEWQVGRVAIPVPDADKCLPDLCRITLRSVSEFGHLMSEVEGSLKNNVIERHEIARIRTEGYHSIQAIAALLATLEKMAQEEN